MELRSTAAQIATMRSRLGSRAGMWSEKGIDFLSLRSRGKGLDNELAEMVIEMYVRGDIDKLHVDTNHKAAQAFNRGKLDSESVVILLLGRRSKMTPDGVQEHGVKLTSAEIDAQKLLADALTGGRRYINKPRR